MKKLLLGALLLGAANFAVTGCIFVSDDDDDNGGDGDGDGDGDVGQVNLTWDVQPNCPVGATTAELVAAPTDGSQMFTNLFNCTDNAGFIDDLPPNIYDIFINITDDDGSTVFARSFSEPDVNVAAGSDIDVATFTILGEEAFFGVDWTISEDGVLVNDCSALLTQLPCANDNQCAGIGGVCDLGLSLCRAPAAELGLVATVVADNTLINDEITCAAEGAAQFGPFLLDDYREIIFSLLDTNGDSLVDTDSIESGSLTIGNDLVDLGTAAFEFTTL